jgi:hypothetical protein
MHIFLTSAVVWGEWSASCHCSFTLGEIALVLLGNGTRHTSEIVWTSWRSENSWPYSDSNFDSLVIQAIASHYTDCTIPAHSTFTIVNLTAVFIILTLNCYATDYFQMDDRTAHCGTNELNFLIKEPGIFGYMSHLTLLCLICHAKALMYAHLLSLCCYIPMYSAGE